MPYTGYRGKEFQSSALAQASFPKITTGVTPLTGSTYDTGYRPESTQGGSRTSSRNLSYLYQQMEAEAKKKNLARETEIRGIYSNILNSISGSNASLRASGLADIERESAGLVGQETQGMISSGLYGTTTAAAIPRNVAAGFTQPSRMKLEDLLAQRTREAQLGLAGFVERIENPYPDYNTLMQGMIASQQ